MLNKIKKFTIGETEYNFIMTNRTILKADEKYGNYGSILAGIMEGEQFYTNALKLICCTCIEAELKVEDLVEVLTPEQMSDVPNFATELYFDYMGIVDKAPEEAEAKITIDTQDEPEKN